MNRPGATARSQFISLSGAFSPSESATEIMLRRAQRIGRFAFWYLLGDARGEGERLSCAYSDGIEQILGLRAEDVVAAGLDGYIARFVHPDDRARASETFYGFRRRDHLQYSAEYRLRHASGEWRVVHDTGEWELSAEGVPLAAAGVLRDVTDHSAIETQLRQSEALLASAQRLAPIGTWRWIADPENPLSGVGRYHHAQAAADIYGVAPDALDLTDDDYIARFVHPEDQARAAEAWLRFTRQGEPAIDVVYRVRHASGTWRTVREVAAWDYGPEGNPVGTAGIVEDLTDRIQAQIIERQRSAMLARAQRIAKLGTWSWHCGPDGKSVPDAIVFSDEAAELYGIAAEALPVSAAERAERFIHPDDRPHYLNVTAGFAARELTSYSTRYRIRHNSSEWRTLHEVAEWDFAPDGMPTGATGAMQDITERLAAEDTLRQSETLLRRVQQIAEVGYWQWKPGERSGDLAATRAWSDSAARIHGADPAALQLSMPDYVRKFVHPEDRERVEKTFRRFHSQEIERYAIEFRVPAGTAGWRTVREVAEWDYGPDGKAVIATGALQDVTGRIENEIALRESEEMLLRAQHIAKLAYWRWRLDFSLPDPTEAPIVYSPAIADIFGLSPEEMRTITDQDYVSRFIHPADQDAALHLYNDFTNHKIESFAVEYRIRHASGEWRTISDTAEWDYGPGGQPIGSSGAIQDVSERVKVETALHQSESLLARAQDIAKLGYWRWRPAPGSKDWYDSDIHYSDTMAKIFGVSAPELFVPDREFAPRFVHPDDRGRIQDVYDRFFIGGESRYEEEYRIRHSSGEWRWIHEIAEWDIGPDGTRIGATGVMQDITARLETEQALRHSEALLTRAQRTARMGHWEWRPGAGARAWNDGIAWYSDTAAEIFGVEPSELHLPADEFVRRYLHQEDAGRVLHIYTRFARSELTRYEIDYRIRRTDGRWRWVHEIAQWDYAENGTPAGATGVLQDMTERVDAETALKKSEASLKRAQQIAKLAHWHWLTNPRGSRWTDGAATYSPEAAEIFGVPVEELQIPALTFVQRFVHPDDREYVLATFNDFLEMRNPAYVIEYRIQHSSGEWRSISERGEWDRTPDGHPAGATGTIQDVTELRETERALKESATQLKIITDNLPVSIGYMDQDERVRFVNATVERWYGIPAQEFIGMTLREAMGDETYQRALPYIREALAGSPAKMQMRRQYQVGPPRDIEMLYIPHVTAGRKVLGFFAVAFDLTERLAMEAQLRQAQKMEAVGQLTGGVAHDFNNLLGVIVGNLDLLALQMGPATKGRELVTTALGAAESGASLIRRLLAFSRRQMLIPKLTNLKELVAGMMLLLRRSLGEPIEIETEIPADLWPSLIDPGQLESAILNLAINARDAMPKGGRLTIALANKTIPDEALPGDGDALPGDYVRLMVRDTGVGIPPDILPRVFEPFFTTKTVGQGTGLGLSMVYGFVKQSGGFLRLDSKVGEGTEISLYLPRAAARDSSHALAPTRPHGSLRGEGEVVLVVEDSADMRAYSVEALRSLNYQSIEAGDARKALEILAQRKNIAVLFSDVVLPGGMSGFELASEARALQPDLKILLTSGYSERAPGIRPDQSEPLLEKPFRTAELGRRLAALLGRAPA